MSELKLLDISAASAKQRKYGKGHIVSHGIKPEPMPGPKLLVSKNELLSPAYLAGLLGDVKRRTNSAPRTEIRANPEDETVTRIQALIPGLTALQLNMLMLREQGLSSPEIARELETTEARVDLNFRETYAALRMRGGGNKVDPKWKMTTLQAAWRRFVLDNAGR